MLRRLIISIFFLLLINICFAENIKILNPNGGEYFTARSSQKIYLNTSYTYYYDLYISFNNGKDWIKPNEDIGSWEWVVPDTTSDSCLFKIIHRSDSSDYDISDSVFSIIDGSLPINLYFPLEPGNKWFFSYNYEDPILTVLEITKDTLMSDGFNYAKIDRYDYTDMTWDTTEYLYLRQENNLIYRYPDDIILSTNWTEFSENYSFHTNTIDSCMYPIRVQYSPVLGIYKPTYYLYEAYPVSYWSYSQDFGFNELKVITWNDWMQETRILRGCVLNGETYGFTSVLGNDKEDIISNKFLLYQNYPNPFNSTTIISFTISHEDLVNITIIDIGGRIIDTLINSKYFPGNYSIQFYPKQLSTGIYFYTVKVGENIQIKKMVYLK